MNEEKKNTEEQEHTTHHTAEHGHHQTHHVHSQHQDQEPHHTSEEAVVHHVSHGEHPTPALQKKQKDYTAIIIGVAVVLGIVLIVNALIIGSMQNKLSAKVQQTKEQSKPAELSVTVIANSECAECFDVADIVESIKGPKQNIAKKESLEFSSSAAASLIAKYGIQKIPAVIVTGDIGKVTLPFFEKNSDALVFATPAAPYTDVKTGTVSGKVTSYLISDKTCKNCYDLQNLIAQLKLAGVVFSKENDLDVSSNDAKILLEKYQVSGVPTLLLSNEASAYEVITQGWPSIGTHENDGMYVMRSPYAPFKNISTGKIEGLVDMTYIVDPSCNTCYNVSTHKLILTNPRGMAITVNSEKTVDVTGDEGKEIAKKYNITKVPTVILSKSMGVYPGLSSIARFFAVQNDGTYVFTAPEVMGIYKDLSTGETVTPKAAEQ